jgi:hypothetical protein
MDYPDAPATVMGHAMAFARTLGTKLHLLPAGDDDQGDAGRLSHREPGAPAGTTRQAVSPLFTLDAFTERLAASEGVDLLDLEPMTTLVVRTAHSEYRIMVLQDTTVVLQGGHCFPEATIAHLRGSGFGGHLLKLAWIGAGMRMEFLVDGKRFVTSTVRAITTEGSPATDRSQ